MEALDDNVFESPSNVFDPYNSYPFYWRWYFYSAFTKEFQRDRVVFHGRNLWAGSHSVSYTALVNVEGEFVLPPAHAFDAAQPELMGLSAGGSFTTRILPAAIASSPFCLVWQHRALVPSALPVFLQESAIELPVEPQESSSSMEASTIGIIVGALVVLLIVAAAVALGFHRRHTQKKKYSNVGNESPH